MARPECTNMSTLSITVSVNEIIVTDDAMDSDCCNEKEQIDADFGTTEHTFSQNQSSFCTKKTSFSNFKRRVGDEMAHLAFL